MFNKIKPVVLGALCLVFISSCKKDDVVTNAATEKANPALVAEAAESYYPVSSGLASTFVDSANGSASTITKSVSILGDTTIDGKAYAKTASQGSKALNYYNTVNGVTSLISYNGTEKITATVLKANEPVGTTWQDAFTNNGVPTTYDWKIEAKGINRSVQGITYSNVIQVSLVGSAQVPAQGKVIFTKADYYYAPNIGLIETTSYDPATGKTELHRLLQKTPASS